MINKLSLLCLSGFLVTSAHAEVIITCKDSDGPIPAEFAIREDANGYTISTLHTDKMPPFTHYKVRERSANVHQATIDFYEASYKSSYQFDLYYPATSERQPNKNSAEDKTSKTEVSVQYNNYLITPTHPEKLYDVVSRSSYKVSGYNLSYVRFHDSIRKDSYEYYNCTFSK